MRQSLTSAVSSHVRAPTLSQHQPQVMNCSLVINNERIIYLSLWYGHKSSKCLPSSKAAVETRYPERQQLNIEVIRHSSKLNFPSGVSPEHELRVD